MPKEESRTASKNNELEEIVGGKGIRGKNKYNEKDSRTENLLVEEGLLEEEEAAKYFCEDDRDLYKENLLTK